MSNFLPEKELRDLIAELQLSGSNEGMWESDDEVNRIRSEAITAINELAINAMLEVIGPDAKLNDIYGDDPRNNFGYNETQVRDAAGWLQGRLRNKLNKMRGNDEV